MKILNLKAIFLSCMIVLPLLTASTTLSAASDPIKIFIPKGDGGRRGMKAVYVTVPDGQYVFTCHRTLGFQERDLAVYVWYEDRPGGQFNWIGWFEADRNPITSPPLRPYLKGEKRIFAVAGYTPPPAVEDMEFVCTFAKR